MTVKGENPYFSRFLPENLPSHWGRPRLSMVCSFNNGQSLTSEDRQDGSIPVYGSNGIVGYHTESLTENPTIIIGRKGSAGAVNYSEKEAYVIDTAYYVNPKPSKYNMGWLYYLLKSLQLEEQAEDSAVPGMNQKLIGAHMIPLPSVSDQENIASFLDNKTNQIDTLIKKNQQLLEVLKEKRLALAEKSVTEGIEEKEPTSNERLKVLGESPSGWGVQRAKTLFSQRDERGYNDLPLLEVSLNTGVRLREENEDRKAWVASDLKTMKRVAPGDLVFNKMRLWQGAIDYSEYEGLVSPDYTVIEPKPEADSTYYAYLLQTEAYKSEVYRRSYGIVDDRLRIYWSQFGDMPILHPPLTEQQEIVQHIRDSSQHIDELRTKLQKSIDLLEEKRQSLITHAVNGQLELSEWEGQEDQELPV